MRTQLVNAVSRASMTGRRAMSSNTAISAIKQKNSFNNAWLSDSATYPLLVCMAGAAAISGGTMVYCMSNSPDVRLAANKKDAIIRNWSGKYH